MWKKIYIALAILVIFILVVFLVTHSAFLSMDRLPKGEFLHESTSPQGTYTVKLYETNPALSAGGTRGELVNNKTGRKRNIYWEYNRNLPETGIVGERIIWEDDDTVIINGRRLNLPNDKYDWRRDL